MTTPYNKVTSLPNFSEIETEVLNLWKDEKTFINSVNNRENSDNFIFYDGPPFANGLPHYGHLLTGFIKDLVARYQTMRGKKVERKFGWDCHGLPAEMATEKDLKISGKVAISEFGIDKFNAYCKESVLKYADEWEYYVIRQGRWVDFEDDYKTMDKNYMESVIWAFKSLYDKGLLYLSSRVMPYSWACETPVSDFETKMDNSYRQKQSKTATVSVRLKINNWKNIKNVNEFYLVIWTTTPWTLPSNLAIAVGNDIKYAFILKDGVCYIIAENLTNKYVKEIGDNVIAHCAGKDLIGLSYEPIFDYFKDHKNAFQILSGDFVTTEDGTGLVHIAPGFGEDDQKLCAEKGIEIVCPVDSRGRFTHPVTDFIDVQVFDTNDIIIKRLKEENKLIKTDTYTHNYPFCWRTDTPLIYKAVPSWYLNVKAIQQKMIANNQKINWIPNHIKDGLFGKWLENARDWSISRNRYWGCPIPVWESDDPKYPHVEVYGSIKEIEESFGVKVEDLHRPFIDTLTKKNPSDPTGKSFLRRVPEILDCWFESGSMPYAQLHYPFENKEKFEKNFPANFIVEYVAQTRGWFYTLLVLSTALFDEAPFLNCICHGVILGDGGQKMSKRLQNYPDPKAVFEKYGSDALRWFMISSPVMRGQELIIDKDGKGIEEAMRKIIKPLWSAYYFFTLYANIDQYKAEFTISEQKGLLDRYIISKCISLATNVRNAMDQYDTVAAANLVEDFIDVLNNWYIRRSRVRFWHSEVNVDKKIAFNTLYTVLTIICKVVAPLLPMVSEKIYLGLGNTSSVHLEDFPNYQSVDLKLVNDMDRVRDACKTALHIRNNVQIKIRQPLDSVTFIGVIGDNQSDEMKQIILDEINVKNWNSLPNDKIEDYANFVLKLNLPVLGKRIPHLVKEIIHRSKNREWTLENGKLKVSAIEINTDEYELKLEPKPEVLNNTCAVEGNDGLVMLDLEITDDLYFEGIARDFIRLVQQMRKDKNFEISDKIEIYCNTGNDILLSAIEKWNNYIVQQALCNKIHINEKMDGKEFKIENIREENAIDFVLSIV